MRKVKGFTLIELLIVVAIIAILAAIAVPNFLEAQVRSKVSRVKADQRSCATGLESYYVDNNDYPAWSRQNNGANGFAGTGKGAYEIHTLRVWAAIRNFNTVTTPIAYLTDYFKDPFADTKGTTFGYYKDSNGWILYSYGPDTDEAETNHGDIDIGVETIYNSSMSQPSITLLCGGGTGSSGAYTYDPSNGTISNGDVYRVKQ